MCSDIVSKHMCPDIYSPINRAEYMGAWRYEIYLLVYNLDISLVCCAHS